MFALRRLAWAAVLGLSGCYNQTLYTSQRADLADADGDGSVARDDCDDGDSTIGPGAVEQCNGVDDDCDGSVDEDLEVLTWFLDADGDGFGDPERTEAACAAPANHVARGEDCDDLLMTVNPEADEVSCNGVDDDCSAATEDAEDADGDGVSECTDCDDADVMARPGGTEICDGIDNDCDGTVDVDAVDSSTWFADLDGDDFGDPASFVMACAPPANHIGAADDCDDTDASVNPSAEEDCTDVDRDCDADPYAGAPGSELSIWYFDGDGDGAGRDDVTQLACAPPMDFVATAGDCDDAEPEVGPTAAEVCAGEVDEDCDGLIDDEDPSVTDALTWYRDFDLDMSGDETQIVVSCDPVPGHVGTAGDCDDTDPGIAPGGIEFPADGVDGDCDGTEACFADLDEDGYGSGLVDGPFDCAELNMTGVDGDCDDLDPTINPGAVEIPGDGVDDNCDGADACFADLDGDGYGAGDPLMGLACDLPETAGKAGDCADDDPDAFPNSPEVPGDGIDQDCDGVDACYVDADADGFGIGAPVAAVLNCVVDPDWATVSGDCQPGDPAGFPGAVEIAGDGVDQSCDGADDCYPDGDGDGWGLEPAEPGSTLDCSAPGEAAKVGDCDDTDAERNPGAEEVWYDGFDSNCGGGSDFDQDGDGFDSDAYGGDDCQDDAPGVYPGLSLSWQVPEDYETPAEAVAAACDSDTVEIAAGQYIGGMDFVGKSLTVRGAGAGLTIIDAESAGRVLTLSAGQVSELTLRGGLADDGGCVAVLGDGVDLGSLEVLDCEASGLGGAIWLLDANDVSLHDLSIGSSVAETGGGIAFEQSSGVLERATFHRTEVTGRGGAVAAIESGSLVMYDLVGTETVSGAEGGFLYQSDTSDVLTATRIDVRVCESGRGAAVHAERAATLRQVVVAGCEGDGVYMAGLDLRHATLVGNRGDGLVVPVSTTGGVGILSAFNDGAGIRGGGLSVQPVVIQSTVFGNGAGDFVDATGMGQSGNLSVDPELQFFPTTNAPEDWNLFLGPFSPCRDAAPDSTDPDLSVGDIGAFGGLGAVGHVYYEDADGDGLYDGFELRHGMTIGPDDENGDVDGDGLLNLEEMELRTLPDREDSDGDGVDDPTEDLAGTDPRDATSF